AENSLSGAKSADSKIVKQNRLGVCSSGNFCLKNPICLVALGADRFEKTIDHKIIFQRQTEFSCESTFDHRVFDDPQHKHFGNAATAILFDHAKRDKPGGSRAALVVKKLSKADWQPEGRKPAIDITQGAIDVGHT